MKSLKIKGQKREGLGKKETKKLREQELVPGVIYGGDEVVHVAIPFSEIRPFVYTPNVYLVDLEIDGEITKAMIQDVQWHPVDEQMLHVDFLKIEADRPVKIQVPVKLTGMAKGTRAGGILIENQRKLRVKALAENLPDFIEIDITKLEISDSIRVEDLEHDNLKFLDKKSSPVVGVISTRIARAGMELPEDEEEEEIEGEEGEEGEETTTEAAETAEE